MPKEIVLPEGFDVDACLQQDLYFASEEFLEAQKIPMIPEYLALGKPYYLTPAERRYAAAIMQFAFIADAVRREDPRFENYPPERAYVPVMQAGLRRYSRLNRHRRLGYKHLTGMLFDEHNPKMHPLQVEIYEDMCKLRHSEDDVPIEDMGDREYKMFVAVGAITLKKSAIL